MPSFSAKVKNLNLVSTDKFLGLGDFTALTPPTLKVEAATIEGTIFVDKPEGTCINADVMVSFPVAAVALLTLNSHVTISWTSDTGGILNGLTIA